MKRRSPAICHGTFNSSLASSSLEFSSCSTHDISIELPPHTSTPDKLTTIAPRLLGSVGLGGPAAIYLYQQRPQKQSHDHHGEEHHDAEKKEAEAPAEESEPQPDRDSEQKTEQPAEQKSEGVSGREGPKGGSLGEPPSNADQVRYHPS